jgi:DNA-binding HxlR family transcriptional regulator
VRRTAFADWPCSVARTVDILGDWWTPLVLRESYRGARRFDEFQRNLGIGRNILAQRLRRLVDEGMLERRRYRDHPVRNDYVLTAKGRDFFPVIVAIMHWGDTWLAGDGGPPILLRHATCGQDMHAEVVCSHCGEPVSLRDVLPRPGPGARPA